MSPGPLSTWTDVAGLRAASAWRASEQGEHPEQRHDDPGRSVVELGFVAPDSGPPTSTEGSN